MKVSIDLGFFADARYMLIVIGKIEKCAQERFQGIVKYEDVFS